ncbi:GPN-loop GTPase 1 [Tachysurus ichikawai]
MATAQAAAVGNEQYDIKGDETPETSSGTRLDNNPEQKPVCLIVLGMAGSGKTTFVQRLTSYLHCKKNPPYVINLDPAVHEVPFPVNIGDFRRLMI